MSQYLTDDQVKTYEHLSKLADDIRKAVDAFDVSVLQANIPVEVKIRCLDVTKNLDTFGLSYRLHPQGEWMGGDQFKTRQPHIAEGIKL